MAASFLRPFKRVTYSTAYLPEVDGLRFLAIFSVVVVMHITGYMNEKFYGDGFIAKGYPEQLVLGGGAGVSLFFMISGFILSLPFARWRLLGERPVVLSNYYLRRLTRLEPPYIIVLVLLFAAQVWVLHKYSFEDLLPRFFASVFYLHTVIYHSFSPILPIAWSLEVEVQFYVLAPLLFTVFLIKNKKARWLIDGLVIIAGVLFWFDTWTLPHVFKFLHFFFCGILLADLFCCRVVLIKNRKLAAVAGVSALAGYFFIPSMGMLAGYLIRVACMFLLFHTVLSNDLMKKIFSIPALVVIGGMCYSIYLLHFAIISCFGSLLLQSWLPVGQPAYFLPFALGFAVTVLLVSALYFVLVEKPFMKPYGLVRQKASITKERQPYTVFNETDL